MATAPDEAERLRAWLDKLDIREVLERYMRWNDDRDADRIAELFDTDATMQVVGAVHQGREAIRAMFATAGPPEPGNWFDPGGLLLQPPSVHISSNPVIDVDGDTATAESDFLVVRRDERGHAVCALAGRYRDRLRRRDDGRWVITCRTGVSVAKPGEERTDAEWSRALARMAPEVRERFKR